jgi:chromate transporter
MGDQGEAGAHGGAQVERGPAPPSFAEALRVWARIGLLSFGGPAGQIALMHRELVEERRWLDEARFLHALNYCMLLPGPEAQQLATYVGWLLHRLPGGLIAGGLFILPGALLILALSALYAVHGQQPAVAALFFGLKAAVLAVVAEALHRVGARALTRPVHVAVASAAFVAIFAFGVPFPWIVLGAGALGWAGARLAPGWFTRDLARATPELRPSALDTLAARGALDHTVPRLWRTLVTLLVGLAAWLGPVGLVALRFGPDAALTRIGSFFSGAAVVTFGGAYAVLSFVAQRAVEVYGWLRPGEMLDGLALAETTPGPLILVLEFVGFLGAYRAPSGLAPLAAGAAGALLTLWATFAPSFLWIFVGGPYVEALRGRVALSSALASITAAVVGVIANLALWFGLHVLFARVVSVRLGPVALSVPDVGSFVPAAAALALVSALCLFRLRLGVAKTLGLVALLGMLLELVRG